MRIEKSPTVVRAAVLHPPVPGALVLRTLTGCLVFSFLLCAMAPAQSASPKSLTPSALDRDPWEIGPLLQGGSGVGDRSSFHFFSAGVHIGKVLTDPVGPGLLRGQFEYAVEAYPYWQVFTPPPHLETVYYVLNGQKIPEIVRVGGGTFTGASITPIILRWNFRPPGARRIVPWVQGAGGLIWTDHKFPPDVIVPRGTPGGTSVFNFTPQFGVGLQYFVRPGRSISYAANAVHISSASLGDRNPGVNASVQFQLGYSWWK